MGVGIFLAELVDISLVRGWGVPGTIPYHMGWVPKRTEPFSHKTKTKTGFPSTLKTFYRKDYYINNVKRKKKLPPVVNLQRTKDS